MLSPDCRAVSDLFSLREGQRDGFPCSASGVESTGRCSIVFRLDGVCKVQTAHTSGQPAYVYDEANLLIVPEFVAEVLKPTYIFLWMFVHNTRDKTRTASSANVATPYSTFSRCRPTPCSSIHPHIYPHPSERHASVLHRSKIPHRCRCAPE